MWQCAKLIHIQIYEMVHWHELTTIQCNRIQTINIFFTYYHINLFLKNWYFVIALSDHFPKLYNNNKSFLVKTAYNECDYCYLL